MNDVTKLIEELEAATSLCLPVQVHALLRRAAMALKSVTPEDGLGDGKIPYKIIVELFNAAVKGTHLPAAKGLTPGRRRMIAQRWLEEKEHRSIEWWTTYFQRIAASDFLSGRTPPSPGHENWRPNFDWFIKPGTVVKVLEGTYDNRGPRTNIDSITRHR
jgi:hypothetical protein